MTGDKVVLVMVGLPARGKTHIARRLARYLSFFHAVKVEVFNVGEYRRKFCGNFVPAEFFNHDDERSVALRRQCSAAAMEDMKRYIGEEGDARVAIFDATNTTRTRRSWVIRQLKELRIKVIFIEVMCEDEKLIDENIRAVKLNLPDYAGMDPEQAVEDFKRRIKQYEKVYESIDVVVERNLSWMKIVDCRRFTINNIRGFLPGRIVQFLMNLHTTPQDIYMSRHGQSEYNLLGKIGGDSGLTPDGEEFARQLADFAETKIMRNADGQPVAARLWTSSLKRTIDTAQFIPHPVIKVAWENDDVQGELQDWIQMRQKQWTNLDELYAGVCDGMTYKEIEADYPDEFARRQADKLAYRYPRGESYLDMMHRLEPMIHEIERIREPVMIIGHQGVLRVIYAFYMGLPREQAPYVSIPLNTVVKLSPHTYGCSEERSNLMPNFSSRPDGQKEPPPFGSQSQSFDFMEPPSH